MTKTCLNCEEEFEAVRVTKLFCSDKCKVAHGRARDKMVSEPNTLSVTEPPEVSVTPPEDVTVSVSVTKPITDVNTIPLSKGGKWEVSSPYKENPGMCKYCGKMSYLVDNVTVDEMIECCHKCASLKNER